MEPFTISCLTCGTPLKVNENSLIGEIVICAKCHSMVLVEAPSDVSAAELTEPTLTELTVADAPAPPPAPAEFHEQSLALSAPVEPPPVPTAATEAEPATNVPSAAPPSTIPVLPKAPSAGLPKWLAFGAAGTVGAMFVVSIWLFWKSSRAPQPTLATQRVPVQQPHKQPESTAADTPSENPDAASKRVETTDTDKLAEPVAETPAPVVPPAPADARPSEEQPKPEAPLNPKPEDPLLLPENSDTPKPEKTDENPNQSEPQQQTVYPIPGPNPDIASRLAMRIQSIEFAGDSLRHVAAVLAQMSAVPIRFDTIGLRRVGLTDARQVTLKKQDMTLTDLLSNLLADWGLSAVATGDHVVITDTSQAKSGIRSVRYTVSDLAANEAQVEELGDAIRDLVAPHSWSSDGGQATIMPAREALTVTQSSQVHHNILVACEKLRIARGLTPRSRLHLTDPGKFSLQSRSSRAAPTLATPVSFAPSTQLPLRDFVQGLSHRGNLTIVLDELSMLRAGVALDTPVRYAGPEKPVLDILSNVLQPLGLSIRAEDTTLLQITSSRRLQQLLDLEFYALAKVDGTEPAQLMRQLREELPSDQWSASGQWRMHYDAKSGYLLVSAPQPIQQQIEAKLRSWAP